MNSPEPSQPTSDLKENVPVLDPQRTQGSEPETPRKRKEAYGKAATTAKRGPEIPSRFRRLTLRGVLDIINKTLLVNESFSAADWQGMVDLMVIRGYDVFVCAGTGYGKSLIFMALAVILRKTILVISPLKVLERDQVAEAEGKGVKATMLNEDNAKDQQLWRDIEAGQYRLVYLSPEMALSPSFTRLLSKQKFRARVGALAVDECHCIAESGEGFRPQYRELGSVRRFLGLERIPCMALTATATTSIFEEVWSGLQFGIRPFWGIDVGCVRPNITWIIKPQLHPEQPILDCLTLLPADLSDSSNAADIPKCLMYFGQEKNCKDAEERVRAILPKPLRNTVYNFSSSLSEEFKSLAWSAFKANEVISVKISDTIPRSDSNSDVDDSISEISASQEKDEVHKWDDDTLTVDLDFSDTEDDVIIENVSPVRILAATNAVGMGCNVADVIAVVRNYVPRSTSETAQGGGRAVRQRLLKGWAVLFLPHWCFRPVPVPELPALGRVKTGTTTRTQKGETAEDTRRREALPKDLEELFNLNYLSAGACIHRYFSRLFRPQTGLTTYQTLDHTEKPAPKAGPRSNALAVEATWTVLDVEPFPEEGPCGRCNFCNPELGEHVQPLDEKDPRRHAGDKTKQPVGSHSHQGSQSSIGSHQSSIISVRSITEVMFRPSKEKREATEAEKERLNERLKTWREKVHSQTNGPFVTKSFLLSDLALERLVESSGDFFTVRVIRGERVQKICRGLDMADEAELQEVCQLLSEWREGAQHSAIVTPSGRAKKRAKREGAERDGARVPIERLTLQPLSPNSSTSVDTGDGDIFSEHTTPRPSTANARQGVHRSLPESPSKHPRGPRDMTPRRDRRPSWASYQTPRVLPGAMLQTPNSGSSPMLTTLGNDPPDPTQFVQVSPTMMYNRHTYQWFYATPVSQASTTSLTLSSQPERTVASPSFSASHINTLDPPVLGLGLPLGTMTPVPPANGHHPSSTPSETPTWAMSRGLYNFSQSRAHPLSQSQTFDDGNEHEWGPADTNE